MISKTITKKLFKEFNINPKVVPFEIWHDALNAEMEHRDIIGDNPVLAAEIAIAHLDEYPDYYDRLFIMEDEAKKFWKGLKKPSIYNLK